MTAPDPTPPARATTCKECADGSRFPHPHRCTHADCGGTLWQASPPVCQDCGRDVPDDRPPLRATTCDADEWVMANYEMRLWEDAERHVVKSRRAVLSSLRALREASGLSLREVARRACVSPAALSQVERDPTSAAMGSMAVAGVLDVLAEASR